MLNDKLLTLSIREVVVPENRCAFGWPHFQVALVTVPSRVQKIHIILYKRLEYTLKISDIS